MTFVSVLDLSGKTIAKDPAVKVKAKPKKISGRGCENCPLDKVPNNRKLKGLKNVKGRKIFIWTNSPNKVDLQEGKSLSSDAGRLLWEELDSINITRDMCDIQHVLRCRPTVYDKEWGKTVDRKPIKQELHCCSVYTEAAIKLNRSKARLHIILGQDAAKTLLGREYRKDTPIFWSEKLQAKVVVVDHPSYLLNAPRYRVITFRERLRSIKKILEQKITGKFSYLDEQDYRTITTYERAKKICRLARRAKGRISVDIEDGVIDPATGKAANEGVRVILTLGISWKSGVAYTFPIDHPDIFQENRRERRKIIRLIGKLMRLSRVRKTFHHGTHDVVKIKECFDVMTRGYDFDTNYSSYLKWPAQKKYGLEEIAKQRIPEFAGYKAIIKPHLDLNKPNFATIPLNVLAKYNCADADIGKRLEVLTGKMDGPLLQTYVDAAFIIDDMQKRGPYFDKKYYKDVAIAVPRRLKIVKSKLLDIAGDDEINLNAWQQCAKVLYDNLRLRAVNEKKPRSTAADDLKLLALQPRGLFPKLLTEYRELSKMQGTYLNNYRYSAKVHNGQLRTLWWLTGTITGRLRSGGKAEGSDGIVNMQNLHGEPLLQNLLVSDLNWRRVNTRPLEEILKLICFSAFDYAQIEIRILAHMSGDKDLIAAVESGDIHGTVGQDLTGISRAVIKKDKTIRTMIKGLHFGIVYGLTPKNLYLKLRSEGVAVTLQRVQELHASYFRKYSRVRQLIQHLQEFGERNNYVETIFGFRRPIVTSGDESGRETWWGNQSVNSPIQGGAHTLMLIAMALLHSNANEYPALISPVAEVHDSFYMWHPLHQLREVFEQGKKLMEVDVPNYVKEKFGFSLSVPLVCEDKAGFRMGSMVEYEGKKSVKDFVEDWWIENQEVDAKIAKKWKIAA